MGISWILLIAAALYFVQNWCYRRFGFTGLRVERKFDKLNCFAGDEVEMIETIVNRKLLPVPWLRLESMIHVGLHFAAQTNLDVSAGSIYQNHKSLFSLAPFTRIVRRHHIRCGRRGWYKLETAAVSIGDMIGVQTGSKILNLELELLVYPRIVSLQEIPIPSSSWQGDWTVKRWIIQDPFLSSGVREYRYGDAMGSIHWKATARSQKLQVLSREYTADPRLVILINTQITETMWDAVTDPELVEIGISYAATLAQQAILHGIPVGFGCTSYMLNEPGKAVYVLPEGGWPQLDVLLETMAKLAVACCAPFHDFLASGIGQDETPLDIVILTPYVSASIQEQIDYCEERGHTVWIIPLEHDLPGAAGKEDAERHAVSSR